MRQDDSRSFDGDDGHGGDGGGGGSPGGGGDPGGGIPWDITTSTSRFSEEKYAAEALHSTIEIDGFSVEFSQENDLHDLGPVHAKLRPIPVIWDWENCTIPTTFGVVDLYENVQKYLNQRNFYISSFDGYGNRKALNYEKLATLLEQDKIKLHHVDPRNRDAGDIEAKKVLLQIMADKLPPSPSLVISGNRDFAKVILSLRKSNYEVYLAYNDKTQADLRNSATKCCRYEYLFGIVRENLARPKRKGGKARKARRLKRLRADQPIEAEN